MVEQYKEYFLNVILKKYATFDGRAGRREFWMFVLFNFLTGMGIGILSVVPVVGGIFSALSGIYSLAVMVPNIAIGVRRLHDIGRKGIFYLFIFIPIVGAIMLIVWFVTEGNPGENEFGPNPKG